MKSFLSLERGATFTCRKNGIERKYFVYEGSEFVNYDLIYEQPTEEENGVKAELTLSGTGELALFREKIKSKLAYYDTVAIIFEGYTQTSTIYRNELFQYSDMCKDGNIHLCLKDVYYPIDYEALGIKSIPVGIAIRVDLKDGLTPTPSRESYISNEKTKQFLIGKIKKIADWFVDRYNDNLKEFPNFLSAYSTIGIYNYYVEINQGKRFLIDSLLTYSSKTVNKATIKGVSLVNPEVYKGIGNYFFSEYTNVALVSGSISTRNVNYESIMGRLLTSNRIVLIGDDFVGNVREYLKTKYSGSTLYIRKSGFKFQLGKVNADYTTYRRLLKLDSIPKDKWRDIIKEFHFVLSTLTSNFIDETNISTDSAFLKWIDDKKEQQRLKRLANKTKGLSVGLNKQMGDVTIAYSYSRYNKIHFKKEAIPLKDLLSNKFLTVLIEADDDSERAKDIIKALKRQRTIMFAEIGKKERLKIPNHHQFINFKKFMTRDCKPFMRLASAIKFEKLMQEVNEIHNYKNGIFKNILLPVKQDSDKLQAYVTANLAYCPDSIKQIIVDVADNHNLYDMSLFDVYEKVKVNIKKYDFIEILREPNSWDLEGTKRYNTLINQILLFRKKYYDDLPEGTKIVFETPKI